MAWQPNPAEPHGFFEGPIVGNCKTVLARDFKEALDYYYLDSPTYLTRYGTANAVGPTGEDLSDFQELVLGPALRNAFPCCGIEPRTNTANEAEDRSHQIEVCRVRLYMAVTHDGPDAVTERLFKYVRVAHLVLQHARADFFNGMSNPFGVILDFEHAYDVVRGDETSISRAAAIEVTVSLRER